jgi:predicted helicase
MYARFFRWAADRLDENGIVAFITNRSFIETRTFDGFRKVIADEFNEIRVLDLGADVRANPKLSGTRHNVFGIQTGVAISFMVRRAKQKGCRIFYARRPECESAEEKLAFLNTTRPQDIAFEEIRPDNKHNWIKQANNDFNLFLPLVTKEAKAANRASQERAIFKLYSLGIVTNRDDWAYDDDRSVIARKIKFFCDAYEAEGRRWRKAGRPDATGDFVNRSIKWTSELETHMKRGTTLSFDASCIVESLYRPFVRRWTYFAPVITHRLYQNFTFFPRQGSENVGLSFAVEERSDFGVIATDRLPNKDMFIPSAAQVVCRWRYPNNAQREENITD